MTITKELEENEAVKNKKSLSEGASGSSSKRAKEKSKCVADVLLEAKELQEN